MKRIDFKFDINDAVTIVDGREGRIFEMRFGGGENYYIVNFEKGSPAQDWALESDILAGHNICHSRESGNPSLLPMSFS